MKVLFTVILLITAFFTHAQTVYVGPDNRKISRQEFEEYEQLNFMIVRNDSLNVTKAVSRAHRSESGTIKNYNELKSGIQSRTGNVIDDAKPVIIIFHPGPDRCNSGIPNISYKIRWYHDLEKATFKIAGVRPLYFYKKKKGLERQTKSIAWNKDPQAKIERTFFDFHYPCSSFVIFNSEGKYVSFFGEFSKDEVLKKLAEITDKNK